MFVKFIFISLFSINYTNDLQPIDDWGGQIGLLEIDFNGDLMPIILNENDKFLELDSNNNLQPRG